MKLRRPDPTEYSAHFARYVDRATETDILSALEQQEVRTGELLASIGEWRAGERYAPGKWSIRQVVGHMEDCERVMAYRALSIGRGDPSPLPGFDENSWMEQAPFEASTLHHRAESLALVRRSTIRLLRDLSDDSWDRAGIANDASVSVRALAYIILGHERHHLDVLRRLYLGMT